VGAAPSVAGVDVAIGGQQHFANLGVFTLSGIVQGCALPSGTENQATTVEKHKQRWVPHLPSLALMSQLADSSISQISTCPS